MIIAPDSSILNEITADEIASYLRLTGWEATRVSRIGWHVFLGPEDADGERLEAVVPTDARSYEARFHLASIVSLLGSLSGEHPETIIRNIRYYEYDVLRIKSMHTTRGVSIPLGIAARQIAAMRRLLLFSACSEKEPRPHFVGYNHDQAEKTLQHYQFGQTFRGSFGYTIESRIMREPSRYIQRTLEGEEFVMPPSRPPLERRIIERIVRGLRSVDEIRSETSNDLPDEEYIGGLNANMCQAIIDMSEKMSISIEFEVSWSPKIAPSRDIADIKTVRLERSSYERLSSLGGSLRQKAPVPTVVKGRVTDLSSNEDPLGNPDADRSVIVNWTYRPGGRSIKVIVPLDKDAYLEASQAHLSWQTVEVTGLLQRSGNLWSLAKPHSFRLVPDLVSREGA